MRYRKLDENRDYTLGLQPRQGFHADDNAVVQAIVTRINLLLGEWWEDLDDGLPLFEQILGRYNSMEDVAMVITERIAGTIGVKRVYDVATIRNPATRLFAYEASVETVFEGVQHIKLDFNGRQFTLTEGG